MNHNLAADTNKEIAALVNAWCDRRAIGPLRAILACYPIVFNLTDHWAAIAEGLKAIRIYHGQDLEPSEMDTVVRLQHLAESIVYR